MAVRAIRGATQLEVDDRDHLLASVDELIREILTQNGLATRRPDLDAVHGHAGPAQRVPGAGRPPARDRRRAAAVRPGDRRRRRHAAGDPGDGARRDRRAPRPRSGTSTCAAPRRCGATSPSESRRGRPGRGPVLPGRRDRSDRYVGRAGPAPARRRRAPDRPRPGGRPAGGRARRRHRATRRPSRSTSPSSPSARRPPPRS